MNWWQTRQSDSVYYMQTISNITCFQHLPLYALLLLTNHCINVSTNRVFLGFEERSLSLGEGGRREDKSRPERPVLKDKYP